MDIKNLRVKFNNRNYLITEHAIKRMEERLIKPSEIEAAVISGEIIEKYPDDKSAKLSYIW